MNKPYPNQRQIAQKQDFKGQSLSFNHRISFDTKGPISPSSEGNSYIMVINDAFTHYVALNNIKNVTIRNGIYSKTMKTNYVHSKCSKNTPSYCQPNKDSICYNLPLHTHDEEHFHYPQILKLVSAHILNGY